MTSNASPEAVKLLQYLFSISGKQSLKGQHFVLLARRAWSSRDLK